MKKITLFLFFLTATFGFSQVEVTVDGSKTWNGYVIAFNADDDTYAFDFGYPVNIIKTTVSANSVTLQPNFQIWVDAAGDGAWFDNPGNPPSNPNKKIEGISYIEDNSLVGQAVNFNGTVSGFTIDPSYEVFAFIKILTGAPNYNTLTDQRVALTATGDFTVSVSAAQTGAGAIVQYGFVVYGLIADPANEGALGSVVVDERVLSINDIKANNFKLFPNPTNDSWSIKTSNEKISSIQVYDILGKSVLTLTPNNTEAKIDATTLSKGLYFAKVSSESGSSSLKLIKN